MMVFVLFFLAFFSAIVSSPRLSVNDGLCVRCLEQTFPSLKVNSHLSTPDTFTQDYCNIQDYFTAHFSQGIVKFANHYKLLVMSKY